MKNILKLSLTFILLVLVSFTASGCFNTSIETELEYAITVAGSIGGTVTGGGIYNEGDTVNAIATPSEGYVFWHWVQGSQIVSTNTNYSFTASDSISVVAFFLLEDQSHLQGTYYLQESLYVGFNLFNVSQTIKRYTLNEDNTYVIDTFNTENGLWTTYGTGNYINDNGVSVTLVSAETETKWFYELTEKNEIEFHYEEIDGLDHRTIYNVLVPWPEPAFRTEHTYTLIAGIKNEQSIVTDEEEPEVFQMNIDGTFEWSYYVEGVLQERTGTYTVVGNSILLNEQDTTFTIYEITFETQAGVEEARMILQKRYENGLTYDSYIFEFNYLT